MNEQFIEGFVKQAVDKGLDDEQIVELFKSAMPRPAAQHALKDPHMHAALQELLMDPGHAVHLKHLLGTV